MSTGRPSCPHLIFNDDGSNFLYSGDDVDADDLRAYLARLQGTQVGMVAYCVAFGGYVTYYQTEVAERLGTGFALSHNVRSRRGTHNLARLQADAGDYLGLVFSTLRDTGLPALASFRMNDAHMSSDPVGAVAGRFWMNHPEWRLGDPYGYYGSCLDYAVPAVREYLRRLVLEVLDLFPDIAGIELDAMRSPFFFPEGEGRAKAPIMTDFIRQVRADLDAVGGGRERYLLRVNVPRTPELSLESGLDVAAWAAEGLVDGIAAGCYNTDFQPAAGQWKQLLGDRVLVHAYANCGPGDAQYHSLEEYRAVAANAYGAGADGVYLFNFPCLDELALQLPCPADRRPFPAPTFRGHNWHPDFARSHQALQELGDPAALAHADKEFLFYWAPAPYRHYVQERAVIERLAPCPTTLTWRCYEDYAAASTLRLDLKLVGVTTRDRFEFVLNGAPLDPQRLERVHAANGRDERLHPVRLEPYSQFTVDLGPTDLRRGENCLTVSLIEGEPDLLGEIEARELTLAVQYGADRAPR